MVPPPTVLALGTEPTTPAIARRVLFLAGIVFRGFAGDVRDRFLELSALRLALEFAYDLELGTVLLL